jgi:hypothetical protein
MTRENAIEASQKLIIKKEGIYEKIQIKCGPNFEMK